MVIVANFSVKFVYIFPSSVDQASSSSSLSNFSFPIHSSDHIFPLSNNIFLLFCLLIILDGCWLRSCILIATTSYPPLASCSLFTIFCNLLVAVEAEILLLLYSCGFWSLRFLSMKNRFYDANIGENRLYG